MCAPPDWYRPVARTVYSTGHRELAAFYPNIAVAYTKIVTITTDDLATINTFRDEVGAQWPFLIFAAMEPCAAFTPWHDKATGTTTLRYKDGKCLHYYVYLIDEEFGLCYLRVPAWAPLRLQFYCNGHNWRAGRLRQHGIAVVPLDNTFRSLGDYAQAQALAASFVAPWAWQVAFMSWNV
jgi:hypothetical protein